MGDEQGGRPVMPSEALGKAEVHTKGRPEASEHQMASRGPRLSSVLPDVCPGWWSWNHTRAGRWGSDPGDGAEDFITCPEAGQLQHLRMEWHFVLVIFTLTSPSLGRVSLLFQFQVGAYGGEGGSYIF